MSFRMFAQSFFLLVCGVLLSLSHLSSGQNLETFLKKHVAQKNLNCNKEMIKTLFNCKERNTFIDAGPEKVKALCKGIADNANVLSRDKFNLIECISKKGCTYKTKTSANTICLTCRGGVPVHLENVGRCP